MLSQIISTRRKVRHSRCWERVHLSFAEIYKIELISILISRIYNLLTSTLTRFNQSWEVSIDSDLKTFELTYTTNW